MCYTVSKIERENYQNENLGKKWIEWKEQKYCPGIWRENYEKQIFGRENHENTCAMAHLNRGGKF